MISILYISSRLLGYVREALLAARYGATQITDAYVVAQELPVALFAAISLSLLMVFIPVYRQVIAQRGDEVAQRFAGTVINAVLLLAALLTVVGWVTAPALLPVLVPGLKPQALALAIQLTRLMLPVMLFMGLGGVLSAVLNANYHFTAPALLPLVSNLFVVGTLVVVTRPEQITWVAMAVVVGGLVGALVQIPALALVRFKYRAVLRLHDPEIRQIGLLVLPVMVSTIALQIQNMIDRFWASSLSEGSIAALSYATRLSGLPYGVIGVAVATVLYPKLAEHVAAGEMQALRETVVKGLRTLAWVLLPMAFGLYGFRGPIVQLFFERGAFDPRATEVTAYTVQFLALGILFFGWQDFLNRSFFVLQDSLTPMWISLVTVVLNVVLNAALVGPLGLGGLALGTTLSAGAGVLMLGYRLRGRLGSLMDWRGFGSVLQSLATAALGVLIGRLLFTAAQGWFPGEGTATRALRLAAGLGTVLLVHLLAGRVLGNRDGSAVLERFGK